MKNFLWLFACAFALSNVLLLTSCGDDPVINPPVDVPPTLTISGISATTVEPGATITFTVTASSGTDELNSLTIQEGGSNMTAGDRYSIEEFTNLGLTLNNPQALVDNDRNNFTYTVVVVTPMTAGDVVYSARVDVQGGSNSDSDEFTVTVEEAVDPGTPITTNLSAKLLLNQAGDAGHGALDLDGGFETGVSSDGDVTKEEAELRDLGIDCNIDPATGENWVGQFGTVNGASMVRVDLNAVENFTFDNAQTVEAIQGAYDSGISLADGISESATCIETTVTNVTGDVLVGDLYVVLNNGRYYLIRLDEINPVADSNDDYFVFSIKY